MPSFQRISPSHAIALLAAETDATLFDVRDIDAYRKGHLQGAIQLSEDRFLAWMKKLEKERPVVIYCYHGNASQTYAQMFADFRFSQVFSVDGGYEALSKLISVTR